MSAKRFTYTVRPTRGCSVVNQVLDDVAKILQSEHLGYCIISTDYTPTADDLALMRAIEEKNEVRIEKRDRVEVFANFLLAAAEMYPCATINQLTEALSLKAEFASLMA